VRSYFLILNLDSQFLDHWIQNKKQENRLSIDYRGIFLSWISPDISFRKYKIETDIWKRGMNASVSTKKRYLGLFHSPLLWTYHFPTICWARQQERQESVRALLTDVENEKRMVIPEPARSGTRPRKRIAFQRDLVLVSTVNSCSTFHCWWLILFLCCSRWDGELTAKEKQRLGSVKLIHLTDSRSGSDFFGLEKIIAG
jgi:hypothetical protein